MKSWKKIFHANRDQKKAGVAILISDKIDVKGHYIMIKGSIQEEDIIIYNNYKYICTQHRSTTICKTNSNKYERGN